MSQYSEQVAEEIPDIHMGWNQDHIVHAEIWNSEVNQSN